MKNIMFLWACLTVTALSSYGQDANGGQGIAPLKTVAGQEAKGGQDLIIAKPVGMARADKTIPDAPQKLKNSFLGKPVVYDGYFAQMFRAENKRALFDLSTPPDPQRDSGNVFFNSRRDIAQPIVLFRIKF